METAVALQLSQRENLIISTGGQLMLDPQNADALMKNGIVWVDFETQKRTPKASALWYRDVIGKNGL